MTSEAISLMGENSQSQDGRKTIRVARAISAELKRRYPTNTIKSVARDLCCAPKAAENLLDGHLSDVSLGRVVVAYGPGWVAERVLEAAGMTLEIYIRSQAEAARATAHSHEQKARELDQLETELRTARRAQPESCLGIDT